MLIDFLERRTFLSISLTIGKITQCVHGFVLNLYNGMHKLLIAVYVSDLTYKMTFFNADCLI